MYTKQKCRLLSDTRTLPTWFAKNIHSVCGRDRSCWFLLYFQQGENSLYLFYRYKKDTKKFNIRRFPPKTFNLKFKISIFFILFYYYSENFNLVYWEVSPKMDATQLTELMSSHDFMQLQHQLHHNNNNYNTDGHNGLSSESAEGSSRPIRRATRRTSQVGQKVGVERGALTPAIFMYLPSS